MSGSSPISPVAAAQPITGGSAPAAPPMTMFCGVLPLQPHRVHDDVEEDREGEQRCRPTLSARAKNGDCAAGKNKSEYERFGARDLAARNWTPGGASHHGIDVGVVPHVEHAGGAGSCGDGENCNRPKKRIEVTGAIINPTSAVKTASTITRGFISATKSGSRAVAPYRDGNCRCETESRWSSWRMSLSAIDLFSQGRVSHGIVSFSSASRRSSVSDSLCRRTRKTEPATDGISVQHNFTDVCLFGTPSCRTCCPTSDASPGQNARHNDRRLDACGFATVLLHPPITVAVGT